jgi:hypothetical protein
MALVGEAGANPALSRNGDAPQGDKTDHLARVERLSLGGRAVRFDTPLVSRRAHFVLPINGG